MWWGYRQVNGGMAVPPWLEKSNPIWLVVAPYLWPGTVGFADQAAFLAANLLGAASLAALAATQLRKVAIQQGGLPGSRSAQPARGRCLDILVERLPGPSLDRNPVLWRMASPSALALGANRVVDLRDHDHRAKRDIDWHCSGRGCWPPPGRLGRQRLSGGHRAPSSERLGSDGPAEERVRGSLDVLLATPLSTRSIVWGKWWGTFRAVPLLAICPGAVAAVLAQESPAGKGRS